MHQQGIGGQTVQARLLILPGGIFSIEGTVLCLPTDPEDIHHIRTLQRFVQAVPPDANSSKPGALTASTTAQRPIVKP